jgi:mRNA-degrading endonuclease RelE of RelBE toxin-antitoxin system
MHFCESSERAHEGAAVLEPAKLYTIELESEVRSWLEILPVADHRAVERFADRLAEDGPLLPFPLSSHLGDGLRELRIGAFRVTYWCAPGRRIVLLTAFRKRKMRQTEEVLRAQRARKECEAEHPPADERHVYSRAEEA